MVPIYGLAYEFMIRHSTGRSANHPNQGALELFLSKPAHFSGHLPQVPHLSYCSTALFILCWAVDWWLYQIATRQDQGLADAYVDGDFTLVDPKKGLLNLFLVILFVPNLFFLSRWRQRVNSVKRRVCSTSETCDDEMALHSDHWNHAFLVVQIEIANRDIDRLSSKQTVAKYVAGPTLFLKYFNNFSYSTIFCWLHVIKGSLSR